MRIGLVSAATMEDTLYDPLALLVTTYANSDNELIHDLLVAEYDQSALARVIITGLDSELDVDDKIHDIMDSVFEIDPTVSVLEFVVTVNDIIETIKRISAGQ